MKTSPTCGNCGTIKNAKGVCRPCANKRNAEYKLRNPEKVTADRKQYKAENKDAIKISSKAYREKNRPEGVIPRPRDLPEEVRLAKQREVKARWKRNNKGKTNEATARRYAAKMQATMKWASIPAMQEFYTTAVELTETTGIPHVVDHIIPLLSEIVCGLHCEANLEVLTAKANRKKWNVVWPDMPEPEEGVDKPKRKRIDRSIDRKIKAAKLAEEKAQKSLAISNQVA